MNSNLIKCACGCGTLIPRFDKKNRPRKFKAGHSSRTGKSDMERFLDSYTGRPGSSCWFWTKSVNPQGYGYFRIDHKTRLAHRISWELYNGKIPSGKLVLHKCDVPTCVNPAHLFIGDHKINYDDAQKKGRVSPFPSTKGKHWKWKDTSRHWANQ